AAGPTPVLAATIAPTPEVVTHVVQDGEGLIGIAAFYGVDLDAILEANGLTADSVIWPGQQLLVPLDALPQQGTWHTVQPGETLETIAQHYGVSVAEIQNTNSLPNPDAIYSGQRLAIPGVRVESAEAAPANLTPTATPNPLEGLERGPLMTDWPRSILEGDLDENYPSIYEHARFTLHYQPGTYPDQNLDQVVGLAADALARVESTLGVSLNGTFDIYVAGTLYEEPNAHLRGMSISKDRRLFVLLDGSGDEAENAYLVTHEMTHLVAWNTLGIPSSTMLSEGLATYVGHTPPGRCPRWLRSSRIGRRSRGTFATASTTSVAPVSFSIWSTTTASTRSAAFTTLRITRRYTASRWLRSIQTGRRRWPRASPS
ncbi:MAG: LysM domain-containing protein, partial [Chloroflexota bacterium]